MNRLRFGILTTQTDARLAELAAQGHERPFEVLVARHRPALERYCDRLLPGGHAEDAVQQALWQAWRALRAGVVVADVRPWLYAIARNQSMTTLRRRRDVEQLDEAAPTLAVDGGLEARATLRSAFTALDGMRGPQREALVRTALNGESQDVIARDLGLSGGAVRQLVHRARVELRAAASALVPFPLIEWLSVGGAGSVAPAAIRGGAAIVAVGAAITATPAVVHQQHHRQPAAHRVEHAATVTPRPRTAEPEMRHAAPAAAPRAAHKTPHHPRTAAPTPAPRTVRVSAPVARPRPRPAAAAPAPSPPAATTHAPEPTRPAAPDAPAERKATATTPVAAPAPVTKGKHGSDDATRTTATQPVATAAPEAGDDKGGEQPAGTTTATPTDDHGGTSGGHGGRDRSSGGGDDPTP